MCLLDGVRRKEQRTITVHIQIPITFIKECHATEERKTHRLMRIESLVRIVVTRWWYRAKTFRKRSEHEKGILMTLPAKLSVDLLRHNFVHNSPVTHGFWRVPAIGAPNQEW